MQRLVKIGGLTFGGAFALVAVAAVVRLVAALFLGQWVMVFGMFALAAVSIGCVLAIGTLAYELYQELEREQRNSR